MMTLALTTDSKLSVSVYCYNDESANSLLQAPQIILHIVIVAMRYPK